MASGKLKTGSTGPTPSGAPVSWAGWPLPLLRAHPPWSAPVPIHPICLIYETCLVLLGMSLQPQLQPNSLQPTFFLFSGVLGGNSGS